MFVCAEFVCAFVLVFVCLCSCAVIVCVWLCLRVCLCAFVFVYARVLYVQKLTRVFHLPFCFFFSPRRNGKLGHNYIPRSSSVV